MTSPRFIELVWLMLPAYCANMAPPFVKYWHGWNRPISRAYLGDHKTVAGFALGIVAGIVTAFLQSFVEFTSLWRPEDWFAVGLMMGAGAMCGDAIKSFFKRRIGIVPGERWIPADQLDFVIGALIPLSIIVSLGWTDVLFILVFTFVADIAVNHASFHIGVRDSRW